MRLIVAVFLSLLAIAALHASEVSGPSSAIPQSAISTESIKKYDPRISPEYLALLKSQAEERKRLYAARALQKSELVARQAKEREELKLRHRAARNVFGNEKHSRDERAGFFRSQRAEMFELEGHQKIELANLEEASKKQLFELHADQARARAKLEEQLLKSHP